MSIPMKKTLGLALLAATAVSVHAQDRLKTMPGYEQHEKIASQIPGSVKLGALNVTWKDATTFEYTRDGKRWSYHVTTRETKESADAPAAAGGRGGRGGAGGPARGRQADSAASPDG